MSKVNDLLRPRWLIWLDRAIHIIAHNSYALLGTYYLLNLCGWNSSFVFHGCKKKTFSIEIFPKVFCAQNMEINIFVQLTILYNIWTISKLYDSSNPASISFIAPDKWAAKWKIYCNLSKQPSKSTTIWLMASKPLHWSNQDDLFGMNICTQVIFIKFSEIQYVCHFSICCHFISTFEFEIKWIQLKQR